MARRIARALCVAAVVWSAAIWLAPLALTVDPDTFAIAASLPYGLASLVCHQRPERSFMVGTIPWAVCARCAGLYLATAAGVAVTPWAPAVRTVDAATWQRWRMALVLAAVPSIVSWLLEAAGAWSPGNAVRSWLAVPFGLAIGVLLASISGRPAAGHPEDLR